MKKFFARIIALAVVVALGLWIYYAFFAKGKEIVSYKTAEIERMDVVQTIDANGTVEPEELVDVGARVSGEIVSFGKDKKGNTVDYGSEISEGDLIALIDDEIPQSDLRQAKAKLEAAKAGKAQAVATLSLNEVELRKAERDWKRAERLGVSEALSQATYDQYLAAYESADAQLLVSKSGILQADAEVSQAEAALKVAERNLEYCKIKAPVDGVVIDRIVNVGQTVVSSMSASSLFLIAKDLNRMEVWASVNEADIGNIRPDQRVTFTVDAFPGEKFEGYVGKIRLNATMSQNVVTYVVEVVTDNSSGRLLPYLTANLSFEVKRKDGALAVPNSALRFTPEDENIADGVDMEKFEEQSKIWVLDGVDKVRPIAVKRLINDGSFSAIESPDIKEGMEVVVGVNSADASSASVSNPFMPKMPQRKKTNSTSTTKGGPPPQ